MKAGVKRDGAPPSHVRPHLVDRQFYVLAILLDIVRKTNARHPSADADNFNGSELVANARDQTPRSFVFLGGTHSSIW